MHSDIFLYGKVKYCLRKMIQILRTTSDDVVLSFIFSQKIVHRRSLFHTPQGVYHRFAQQIYFTVGCAYPYAQPTKGGLFGFAGKTAAGGIGLYLGKRACAIL